MDSAVDGAARVGVVGVLNELNEETVLIFLRELSRKRLEAGRRVVARTPPEVVPDAVTSLQRDDLRLWVCVHEIAHQWFGGAVGIETWEDVWVKEGLATFAEWLWAEHTAGPDAYAAAVASAVRELAGGAREAERARVQSLLATHDPARIPPLDTMSRSLDALYARFGLDPAAPADADDARIQALLAANLDGALFRPELARLAEELAQAREALEVARARADAFEAEARGWIAKLEADVRAVQEELRRAVAERDALATEADRLRLAQEALDRLPSPLRRLLLKLAFDARR